MSEPDPSRVPGRAEFNPFPQGSYQQALMERVKSLGCHSEACWKVIELSHMFSSVFLSEGAGAATLAFAARSLLLCSPQQERFWAGRGLNLEQVRQASFICAREALASDSIETASGSHWHLLLSACFEPFAPSDAKAMALTLWPKLSPKIKEEAALSALGQISRLSKAFAAHSSRLRPPDQLAAAELCARLCSLSPELAPLCASELRLARRLGRVNAGGRQAAEWLASRLEGIALNSVITPASADSLPDRDAKRL